MKLKQLCIRRASTINSHPFLPFFQQKQNNMASSLRFLKVCLSFKMLLHFLFFISPSFSFLQLHPKNNDILLSSTASPSTLIRGLNLFPKSSINIPENDPHVLHGNIVEKKFTFPGFDDSGYSVEELGHHAGYYSLPHSKAAR
jgi:serine carboxypeptidase-like clade IV